MSFLFHRKMKEFCCIALDTGKTHESKGKYMSIIN